MSSLKDSDKPCARVAIKVPRPDSLIEVRMTPPDSDFEVKVLPGEEAIELTIRPGNGLIEVRIGPEDEKTGEARLGPARIQEAGASQGEEDDEVVPGVSRAEFEVMVEEDQGAEAQKLLAQMPEIDEEPEAPSPPPAAEDENDPEHIEIVVTAHPKDPPPELNPADPSFKLPVETIKLLVDDNEAPLDPAMTEALADPVQRFNVMEGEGGNPAPATESAVGPAAREALARLSAAIGEERAALDSAMGAQNDPPETERAEASGETGEAETDEAETDEAELGEAETGEAEPDEAETGEVEPASALKAEAPAKPDSTVMVELYNDGEAAQAPATAAPLSEEEEMDLGPVEEQDEDLSLGAIDVAGLEGVDLDKSHAANHSAIKAKPLIKAAPSGTIVPA